jgi:hypothetical protein
MRRVERRVMASRFGLLLIGVLLAATASRADEFADFTAAVESFSAHNRAALRNLRHDDVGPMSDEVGEMRTAWAVINGRFGKPPPQLAADRTLYTTTLVDVSMRLVGVSMFIQMGSRSGVRNSLTAIRADLSALRKANGIVTLADCIFDANRTLTTLMAHGDPVPDDWSKPDAGSELSAKVAAYGQVLDRCDSIAGARAEPRFHQLIDKTKAMLAALAKALAAHDTAHLRVILDDWRNDDDELAFRYG